MTSGNRSRFGRRGEPGSGAGGAPTQHATIRTLESAGVQPFRAPRQPINIVSCLGDLYGDSCFGAHGGCDNSHADFSGSRPMQTSLDFEI